MKFLINFCVQFAQGINIEIFLVLQKTSLAQMLYLADNLAYFPYQVQDEPLFIVHHIDVMISMSGTNLLQSFREALIPPANQTTRIDPNTGQVEVRNFFSNQ